MTKTIIANIGKAFFIGGDSLLIATGIAGLVISGITWLIIP